MRDGGGVQGEKFEGVGGCRWGQTAAVQNLLVARRWADGNGEEARNEFLEDVSTFTFAGDVMPLNVLPQESSTTLKEPPGVVFSENLTESTSDDTSSRITRQLTEESNSIGSGGKNQSLDANPIRQVIDKAVADKGLSRKVGPQKLQRSSQISGKTRTKKQNEQTVPSDARICQLKDQLIRAKIYLSLLSTRNNPHFIRELRLRIKEVQRALGDATKDSELPRNASERFKAMEQTLLKGKQMDDDCSSVVKKLRAMLHLSEDQLRAHKKHALFLTQLTAKMIPKGLHCLPLRLTTEYFTLNSSKRDFLNKENVDNPNLYHYALFSDNVLAASVVVNSTVTHTKDPSKHVFHVVTDKLNYAAMKMWFLANPPGKATIHVQNVDEFTWLNSSYSPVLRQLGSASMIDYYFKNRRAESDSNLKFRNPKYLSIMNHLRFYLPEIFPNLDKILFLDDDVVVQKELTGLWSLDLNGKVIGVVETCGESFHRFDRYLNFSNPLISRSFSPRACGWAFGMNIFDLDQWRKQNITQVYHKWQNLNHDRLLWKLGTLPPGLITFWNHTYALDKAWHVLGLGYNPGVAQRDIDRAAVIHYNGNLKPWLEIGIPKFRSYWAKFVDYDHVYLRECNITP
ncbi:PREDICTED: probable galacturonosyltransferase 4 isoform X2 [Erythranthe guttata]|uniref:probable galacturonosyltransferase 4 isoform X2 n=1 Tax=Erythranthe guttata TaxID=4155 RepID=UPI00064E1485|nr:PREDICTED: probable galacturonosyltransferase 4 isoform X2 [Erythranthe guttata]|eukprot:XP_012848503.1 PREDICTED: probable galacturonosyltransferase 4 isoform X2 [Erythranthe guttata]